MQATQQQAGSYLKDLTRRARTWLMLSAATSSIACILFILQLCALAALVDNLTFKGHPLDTSVTDCIIILALSVSSFIFQWLADMTGKEGGLHISASVQRDALIHLTKAGPAGCAKQPAGQLITTMTEAAEALEPYFSQYIPRTVMMVVLPIVILGIVFHFDIWSFVILACTGPLIPFFMVLVGYNAQSIMDRQWTQLVLMGSSFLDSLRGLMTLRLNGQTTNSITRLERQTEAHRHATFSVMRVAFLTSATLEFFASLSVAMVAVIFGSRLLAGTADFRSAFIVLVLAPEYFIPLRNFSSSYHARQNAMAAAKQLQTLFTLPEYAVERQSASEPVSSAAPVTMLKLNDISASYEKALILKQISAEIRKGQLTAVSGESGSGKTTLLYTLMGFLPLRSGSVAAYDAGGAQHPLTEENIAWVPQRPLMAFGSIADNLRLGAPEATDDDLKNATRQAGIFDFIMTLPEGFNTQAGERGARLSGGQIRRLSLARALLRNPDILCLDEPTANLDPDTADTIIEMLKSCAKTRIVLVATHDQKLISAAQQVLHINEKGSLSALTERAVA